MNTGYMGVFLNTIFGYTIFNSIYRKFAEDLELKGDERILEFGCGTGALSRNIVKYLKDTGCLTCVDINEFSLKLHKRNIGNYSSWIEYITGDIRELGIKEAAYDIVVIHMVLHCIEKDERESFIKELSRSLKCKGKIFIREPNVIPHDEIRKLMAGYGLKENSIQTNNISLSHLFSAVFVK